MYDDAGDQKARQPDGNSSETGRIFGKSGIGGYIFSDDSVIRKTGMGMD